MDNQSKMSQGKIIPLVVKFSVPAIIGMFVNALYNVVDRIFIGKGVGEQAIAGITAAFPMMQAILALSIFIGVGTSVLVAIKMGEMDKEGAQRVLSNSLILIIGASILTTLFGLLFLDPLLVFFGAVPSIMGYARDYLYIIILGSVFSYLSIGLNNTIRATGSPNIAMYTMLIGAIINVILDYVFIMIFHWGIKGAAIATIIGQGASGIWVLWHFIKPAAVLRIHLKNIMQRFCRHTMIDIVESGSAQGIMQLMAVVTMTVMNYSLKTYGNEMNYAACGIFNSISLLIFLPVLGVNQGCQPLIGYHFGAKSYRRMKKFYIAAIVFSTAVITVGFAIVWAFAPAMVKMFVQSSNHSNELIDFTVKWVKVGTLLFPLLGFQVVTAGFFQAMKKKVASLVLSLSRQTLFFIPAILVIPKIYGIEGIMYAQPVSDALAVVVSLVIAVTAIENINQLMDVKS